MFFLVLEHQSREGLCSHNLKPNHLELLPEMLQGSLLIGWSLREGVSSPAVLLRAGGKNRAEEEAAWLH